MPIADTYTLYYDNNYNYLGSDGADEYTVVNSTMNLPLTARVNDTGILFTETIYPSSSKYYSIGTNTISYTLEPDTATTALLKLITIEKDLNNANISTSVTVMRLTTTGSFTSLYETYVDNTDNLKMSF